MKLLKAIVLASLIAGLAPAAAVNAKPVYVQPPINPFDARGYCFGSNCATLYLGATINALQMTPMAPMSGSWPTSGPVPAVISMIWLSIDNDGYSNWWTARASLVSSDGVRIDLGVGKSDDGNDLESLNIKCEPKYRLNECSPYIYWGPLQFPANIPVRSYALEVSFSLYDGRPDATYTFGPNFMVVTHQITPQNLDGKQCFSAGSTTTQDGVRYACVKRKKKMVWRRI